MSDVRWCGWCGDTLEPHQTGLCSQKCADDLAADYRRESRQRASASSCGAEGGASATRYPPINLPAERLSAGTFWTEEETDALRRDGCGSAAETALALTKAFQRPISRRAVIGKCYREGITPPWKRQIWKTDEPTPNPFPDVSGCLWPHGHPNDPQFHFCGGYPLPGKPYCAVHAEIVYVRAKTEVA